MKEKRIWSRLVAMMLAVAMVITSQPVSALADAITIIGVPQPISETEGDVTEKKRQ